jgi:hypothetical protein
MSSFTFWCRWWHNCLKTTHPYLAFVISIVHSNLNKAQRLFVEFSIHKYYRSLIRLYEDRLASPLLRYRLFWRHIPQRCFKGLRMIFVSLADVWSFSLLITSLPSKDLHTCSVWSGFLKGTFTNFQVFRDVTCVWVIWRVDILWGFHL